jgi:hypothetical protein
LLVSPVSSKTNDLKPVPGTNLPFSGRLRGVPCLVFARALASNAALPSTSVLALGEVRRVLRHEAVDERVGLLDLCRGPVVGHAAAADVLDDDEVAELVVVDPLVAALAHRAVVALDGRRRRRAPLQRLAEDAAEVAGLGGEQQLAVERVVGGAVDRAHAAVGGVRGQRVEQRDAVRGVLDVEVDPREVRAVVRRPRRREHLVALDQEAPAVVVAGGRAARVAARHQIAVLVGLGLRRLAVGLQCRVVEVAVASEDPGGVLERVVAVDHPLQLEPVGHHVRRAALPLVGVRDAADDLGDGDRRSDERDRAHGPNYEDSTHVLSLSLEIGRGIRIGSRAAHRLLSCEGSASPARDPSSESPAHAAMAATNPSLKAAADS